MSRTAQTISASLCDRDSRSIRTRIRAETMTCGRYSGAGRLHQPTTIAEHHPTFSAEQTAWTSRLQIAHFPFLYYIDPLLFGALIFIITPRSTSAFVPGV